MITFRGPIEIEDRVPALAPHAPAKPLGGAMKRGFDIVFATVALLSMAPLMIGIALTIRAVSSGPVLYRHRRIGLNGRPFDCYKFRTMCIDSDRRLRQVLKDDPRARAEWQKSRKLRRDPRIIPRLGHFLRASSLDELPQFFNVLIGQMSVIGPRPVPQDELLFYGPHVMQYAAARPGISGLWQISGRSDTTYEDRVRLDVDYVCRWSFLRDLWIIWRTVRVVLGANGSY